MTDCSQHGFFREWMKGETSRQIRVQEGERRVRRGDLSDFDRAAEPESFGFVTTFDAVHDEDADDGRRRLRR
jgi:hypothetical protein